jgi:hypothetical protein
MSFTFVKPKIAEAIKQAGLVDEKGMIFYVEGKIVSINGDVLYFIPYKDGMFGTKVFPDQATKINKSEIVSAKFEDQKIASMSTWKYCVFSLPYGKSFKILANNNLAINREKLIDEILKMWSIPEAK